jgi:hypothetical protein
MELDDRKSEPLEIQLVAELRRLSGIVNKLANETERRIGVLAVA